MDNIKQQLINLADEKYREFNQKLCPDSKRKFLGIKIPVLRNFSKELLKKYNKDNSLEGLNNLLNKLDDEYFEEVIVKGFVIGLYKTDLKNKLKFIKEFVPLIDSWAISDSFVPSLKIKKEDLELYYSFIKEYLDSDKEFFIRFGIISLLDYYIIDKYVDDVINILNNISHEGYYVKMGVAWCLCEIGIKYNKKFMKYMKSKNNKLDKFTYNKALQKMIESYRIDDAQKDILRQMKRKDK